MWPVTGVEAAYTQALLSNIDERRLQPARSARVRRGAVFSPVRCSTASASEPCCVLVCYYAKILIDCQRMPLPDLPYKLIPPGGKLPKKEQEVRGLRATS